MSKKKSNVVPLLAPRRMVLGTKVVDPLVRYSERDFIEGPYRPCIRCKPPRLFTYLGLATHKRWHAKQDVAEQDAKFARRAVRKKRA